MTSFVDPHDITLWGNLTLALPSFYMARQLEGSTVPARLFDGPVPDLPERGSLHQAHRPDQLQGGGAAGVPEGSADH